MEILIIGLDVMVILTIILASIRDLIFLAEGMLLKKRLVMQIHILVIR